MTDNATGGRVIGDTTFIHRGVAYDIIQPTANFSELRSGDWIRLSYDPYSGKDPEIGEVLSCAVTQDGTYRHQIMIARDGNREDVRNLISDDGHFEVVHERDGSMPMARPRIEDPELRASEIDAPLAAPDSSQSRALVGAGEQPMPDTMELRALQSIAAGIESLAELERRHPVLGANLEAFVETVNDCCREAYQRFSTCLDDVLTLPSNASEAQKAKVLKTLRHASDSQWFKDVAGICDRLAGIADTYDADLTAQREKSQAEDSSRSFSIMMLLMILHRHEGSLKEDVRYAVDQLKIDIADSRIGDAQQHALALKNEIAQTLTRISGTAMRITGSTTDGANKTLTKSMIAAEALRAPERVLLFNMGAVLALLIAGAAVLQYVTIAAFTLLVAFIVTSIVVLNAFYLRSIGALAEEPFMELMKLALLNFFAPLLRGQSGGPARSKRTTRKSG